MFDLITTNNKNEATIKATVYECEGDKALCNGQKIVAVCDGKKSSIEKVVMKCKCNAKRGRCKLKVKPNVANLQKRHCKKIVTTTELPTTTTIELTPSEIGACYLDKIFYTDELKLTSELAVNGMYPEGTIATNAVCHVGGVYMAVIRRQSGNILVIR